MNSESNNMRPLVLIFNIFCGSVISASLDEVHTANKRSWYENADLSNTNEFYCNKIMLAPMVRMNTLPFRLLALDYGADIVYSEEIVDFRILRSRRQENEFLNTIDYVDIKDGSLVFRTCPRREKDKLVIQLGCADPDRAAKAAMIVSRDVVGIDINMGCPEHFSTVGGMGAKLLSDPERARRIIEAVRKAVDLPVTCKIRVHENIEETISFCKQMIDGGVIAIAVHGRTKDERPRHRNRLAAIKNVSSSLSVPVIANGGSSNIGTYEDILSFKKETGCTSVMIGRAAQCNPSVFRKEGKLPTDDVIKAYLKYAVYYNNVYGNTKYCVRSMLRDSLTTQAKALSEAQTYEQICKIWDMDAYFRQRMNEHNTSSLQVVRNVLSDNDKKRLELDAMLSSGCQSMRYKFQRLNFPENTRPKVVLENYAARCHVPLPKYYSWDVDHSFRAVVTFEGKNYTSTHWEKNRKSAEHAASAVCLFYLKLYNEHDLRQLAG